jgi:hypothetical protein
MATSFSGGRSRSTRREPPTMGKHMNNQYFRNLWYRELIILDISVITCASDLSDIINIYRDRRDRMVVGFTTTYAISAYQH